MKKLLLGTTILFAFAIGVSWLRNSYNVNKEISKNSDLENTKTVSVNPIASLTPKEILTRSKEFEGKQIELIGSLSPVSLGVSDKQDGLNILEMAFTTPDGAVVVSGGNISSVGAEMHTIRGVYTLRSNAKYKVGLVTIPIGCRNCIEVVSQ